MDFISPWIHTTDRCNLKCHYCYVKGNNDMSTEVYDNLGDMLLKFPVRKHLRFAGGEPTLTFSTWKPFAIEMLKHKNITVEVLTNLIDPPKEFWSFAELNNVGISVSIDNGRAVKVLDKSMIRKLEKLNQPWVMTTITDENINNLDTLATFVGLKGYGWAITTDYFAAADSGWDTLSKCMLNVVNILKKLNYDLTKISFNNFSIKSGFSGCRAGNEMFAVDCNGDIYRCQTFIGNSFPTGNVFKGSYKRSKFKTRNECKQCTIGGLCSGWCPAHFRTPNKICNVIKLFANEILKETTNA